MVAIWLVAGLLQPAEDIDAFMKKVLEHRQLNWEQYYNYFGRERETLEIESTLSGIPIHGFEREYLWYVRDGYVVRSPISVDGVAVPQEERDRAEEKWIERQKEREKARNPDRETFLGFRFEPGNYFYAGSEMLDGREVVLVEYYPDEGPWNGDEEDSETEEEKKLEADISKTLLVKMWIDPEEHQIVRMSLDNAGFDFLPARWLLQLDTVEATLTMFKPFESIWLAQSIEGYGKLTTAAGSLEIRYRTRFYDYARGETSATYRFLPRDEGEKKKRER